MAADTLTEPAAAPLPVRPGADPDAVRSAWVAAIACVALALIWGWLAWERGGFFPIRWYPAAALTYGVLALLLAAAPWRVALRGAPAVAAGALALLAAWAALSMLWSPAPDVAFAEAQRIALYLATFAIGLWLANLLGRNMLLVLVPVVAATAVVSVMTLLALSNGNDLRDYLIGAVLRYPIGYHSANSAYFAIAFWPALVLAGHRGLDGRLRALSLAAATIFVELAVLSQSRGSALAAIPAIAVYVVASADRLRALLFLALALLPAAFALGPLLHVFDVALDGPRPAFSALDDAARAITLTAIASGVIGGIAALLDRRVAISPLTRRRIGAAVVGVAVAAAVAGAAAFVRAEGSPVGWTSDRYHEFAKGGNPTGAGGSRFLVGFESNRNDFWRVAWDEARDHPLLGTGPGGYEFAYLEHRHSTEQAHDPHSIELRFLTQLGIPGLLLFGAFGVAAFLGAARSRSLGGGAAALSTAALAAGTYWLAHTSVDWFFDFPAITAPAIAMLGAAAAPPLLSLAPAGRRAARVGLAAGAAAVVALSVPAYLSARYTEDAYHEAANDVRAARADLDRAADLDPFAAEPDLVKGFIALRRGEDAAATRAFAEAGDRQPRNWLVHYGLGVSELRSNPRGAIRALRRAHRLNPLQPVVRRRLQQARRAGARR